MRQYIDGSTYHIAVYTGSRAGSGTSATVSMILSGRNIDSEAFTLRNRDRLLFTRGSVESFLVSVEKVCYNVLGILIYYGFVEFYMMLQNIDLFLRFSILVTS